MSGQEKTPRHRDFLYDADGEQFNVLGTKRIQSSSKIRVKLSLNLARNSAWILLFVKDMELFCIQYP